MLRALALALSLTVLVPAAASAQDDVIDPVKLREAIDKGVAYLKGLQQPDGSFQLPPNTESLETNFPLGYSALATLTLLKCGVKADDPIIDRAFTHLYSLPLRKTYEVSMLILAIEARFAPPEELLEEKKELGYTTVVRGHFQKKARKLDNDKLTACVNWLIGHQSKSTVGGWRYPEGEIDQDNSCTQYAMLALKGARRLGAEVPMEVFERVADFLVQQQDETGPEVAYFPVPAADMAIHEMLTLDQRRKREEKEKKEEEKRLEREAREAAKGQTREREGAPGTAARGNETTERRVMNARGWGYLPRPVDPKDGGRQATPIGKGACPNRTGPVPTRTVSEQKSTGSMTCSGIAALCIAKSELENAPASWRPREEAVETAIRDGCAFLANWWNPKANIASDPTKIVGWQYYYFYSVERAGVLCGTYRFGDHDWWDEITEYLLGAQQAEGSWPDTKGLSKLSPTCFALLVLERSTIPLVPLPPKRVMTGHGGAGR